MANNTKAVNRFKKEVMETLLNEFPDAVGVAQQVQHYARFYGSNVELSFKKKANIEVQKAFVYVLECLVDGIEDELKKHKERG